VENMINKGSKILSGGGQLTDPDRENIYQLRVRLKNRQLDMDNLTVYIKKDLDTITEKKVENTDYTDFNLIANTYKIFTLFDRDKLSWATDDIIVKIPDQSKITIDLNKATIDDSLVDPS
jgi:hypothetical protein